MIFLLFLSKQKTYWLPPKKGLVVLMYHHIGAITKQTEAGFFINEEMFSAQLEQLLDSGYTFLSFSDVENAYKEKKPLPPKSVLITFDDGWKDNFTAAYPILKEKKIKANIFLNVGDISAKKDFLSWEEVSEMFNGGLIEFASHGMNHRRLRSLTNTEIKKELLESKKILENKLGCEVKSFCYPYGAVDKRVRSLVFESGYIIDYGTRKGINSWPWNAKHPIKRAHIMAGESLADFHLQLTRGRYKL
jgi:peptidoglycan/xylan/chitin deacetylase (PgdA/CDA1 family)